MTNRFLLSFSILLIISGLTLISSKIYLDNTELISPVVNEANTVELPLALYSIDSLKSRLFPPQDIIIADQISDNQDYSSNLFFLTDSQSTVSGLLNLPKIKNPRGIIILLRGYVDREIYQTGIGTRRIGERLSTNGFITLAPDFLGYAESSSPSAYPLEERFQTYTTALTLLNSLSDLQQTQSADSFIGLFGHSNGGHIALAVLEVTGASYPTVLWAPVAKPFPFSVLAYTDEFDDKGYALRKLIADFEKDYDVNKYSIDNYFDAIQAPLSIHQGLSDQEVPFWWSDEMVQILKDKNKQVEYFKYPGEDHNFNAGTWETLATRTLNFYLKQFSAF